MDLDIAAFFLILKHHFLNRQRSIALIRVGHHCNVLGGCKCKKL
jgi:hypothetical protein